MIEVIIGKTGQGKSYYMKNHVRRSILPCIIVDSVLEYGQYAVLSRITDDIRFNMFKMRFFPDTALDFDLICRCVCQQRSRQGINFYIEEIDLYTSAHTLPMYFERCLKLSRHRNIHMMMTVQNPAALNSKIRNLAHRFVIFRITEPLYLKYFQQFDHNCAARLPHLGVGEKIVIDL